MPQTPQRLRIVAQVHWQFGLAFGSWGWEWGARHAFRDAIRADPRLIAAHLSLADSFARSRRWGEAAHAYRQATRVQPSSVDAQGNLVLALVRASQPARAVDAVEGLIRARPGDPLPHLLRGTLLLKLGRRAEAIHCFRWAAQLPIDDNAGRFTLGPALVGPASWRRAVAQYRQARDLEGAARPASRDGKQSRLNLNPGQVGLPSRPPRQRKAAVVAVPERASQSPKEIRSLNLHRVWRARRAAAAQVLRIDAAEARARRRRA